MLTRIIIMKNMRYLSSTSRQGKECFILRCLISFFYSFGMLKIWLFSSNTLHFPKSCLILLALANKTCGSLKWMFFFFDLLNIYFFNNCCLANGHDTWWILKTKIYTVKQLYNNFLSVPLSHSQCMVRHGAKEEVRYHHQRLPGLTNLRAVRVLPPRMAMCRSIYPGPGFGQSDSPPRFFFFAANTQSRHFTPSKGG